MAALTDSIGLIFKIKADSSQAKKEFKEFKKELKDAEDVGKDKLARLGHAAGLSAQQFSNLKTGVLSAAAALGAIGVAAVGTAAAIWKITTATAEFGSKLYDAAIQTGLSARSISALNLAAEQSGTTLEQVAGSVAKLNVVVGQAALGNEKAQATLERYGITAKDTNTAFEQAVKVIGSMTDQGQKAAAMQALFRDRTGQLGVIIDQVNGDFKAFTDSAEKLGLTLREEDIKAADDFGDTLKILEKQAAAVGQQFAFELMPNVTHAMKSISGEMATNQSVAREWGRVVGDVVRGMELSFTFLSDLISLKFLEINAILGTNIRAMLDWKTVILSTMGVIGQTLEMLRQVGGGSPIFRPTGTDPSGHEVVIRPDGTIGPAIKPRGPTIPQISAGGGGRRGGGGGGSPKDDAEARRREAVQAAKAEMQDTLQIYAAGYKERLALLDFNLAQKYTSELNYIRDVGRIHLEALLDEKRLNERLLENANLNLEERKDIANKIKALDIEIRTQRIETATKVIEQINKESEAEEEAHQKRLKRAQEISERRQKAFQDAQRERDARSERDRNRGGEDFDFGIGGSLEEFKDQIFRIDELFGKILIQGPKVGEVLAAIGNIGFNAFKGMAQAVGQLVQNWVLMGTTGPAALRKILAATLASVAAESAVLAIFELAKGFASLFWNPAEAAAHFKAAALFGAVAIGAGLAGRAVAGDLFNQQTAQATGGAQGSTAGGGNRSAGGAYSTQPDRIVNAGANTPRGLGTLTVRIQDDQSGSSALAQLLRIDWQNNGPFRQQMTKEFG